jgi:hypothetical protein
MSKVRSVESCQIGKSLNLQVGNALIGLLVSWFGDGALGVGDEAVRTLPEGIGPALEVFQLRLVNVANELSELNELTSV